MRQQPQGKSHQGPAHCKQDQYSTTAILHAKGVRCTPPPCSTDIYSTCLPDGSCVSAAVRICTKAKPPASREKLPLTLRLLAPGCFATRFTSSRVQRSKIKHDWAG